MEALTTCPANVSYGAVNQLLGLLIQSLMGMKCEISSPEMWPADHGEKIFGKGVDEYDFVIVGGGTAGSIVANRLSENPEWKVLLLEAGGDPTMETEIPWLTPFLIKSDHDWNYPLDSSNLFGLAYTENHISAGKVLGGSSSINDMLYLRGYPRDYDAWTSDDDKSWSYEKIFPYFRKSEHNNHKPYVKRKKNKIHSTEGENYVDYFQSGDTTTMLIKDGMKELHWSLVDDFNNKEYVGFGTAQGFVHKGLRQSTAKAFLIPAKDRPNLHIIKNAQATQILFEEQDQASGVKFVLGGKRFKVRATKEVILSAGAINTPKILMLSGIGAPRLLRKFDVPFRENLPVGENLQDHVTVPLFLKMKEASNLSQKDWMDQLFMYLKNRIGFLGSIGSYDFTAFVNTTDDKAHYPDIRFNHRTFIVNDLRYEALSKNSPYIPPVAEKISEISTEKNLAIVDVVLLKPKSRGKIRLESKIPVDKPKVIGGYLSQKQDMETLMAGVRAYLKLLKTDVLTTAGIELVRFELDTCDELEYDSDAYWQCYVTHFARGANHVVGTAKMGPLDDKTTVVDYSLKVKGIRGLRVIDASVIPEIVSVGTQPATMMIAEKGSDLIKETWKTEKSS